MSPAVSLLSGHQLRLSTPLSSLSPDISLNCETEGEIPGATFVVFHFSLDSSNLKISHPTDFSQVLSANLGMRTGQHFLSTLYSHYGSHLNELKKDRAKMSLKTSLLLNRHFPNLFF